MFLGAFVGWQLGYWIVFARVSGLEAGEGLMSGFAEVVGLMAAALAPDAIGLSCAGGVVGGAAGLAAGWKRPSEGALSERS